jgi:hypothetical protein
MKMSELSLTSFSSSLSFLSITKMITQAAAAAIKISVNMMQIGFAYVLQNPLLGFPAKLA